MFRRFISAVALVAGLGAYAFAAERATFILNNGERKTGELSASGPESANFVNGQLTLSGQPIPLDQVAVIDVSDGGTPPAIELSRVPSTGSSQAVVMKSGHAEAGKFVNIVRGDTLLWEDHTGKQQQYPLSSVTRIYLNAGNAHAAYRQPASGSTAPAVGTSGQATPAGGKQITVNANTWTDTGLTVKAGDMVSFQASGQINWGQSSGQTAGPDGNPSSHSPNYPVPSLNVGTLLGKIGSNAPFGIGNNTQPIRMPASGKLLLGVNDNELNDNSGSFTVTVSKQ